ncbi:hypothetical protein [Sphingomonas sp.]|uniref:hypothetical protein n=1 Tax=Sphingomonas sp. TaxID=28214 RepID=UPI003B3B0437
MSDQPALFASSEVATPHAWPRLRSAKPLDFARGERGAGMAASNVTSRWDAAVHVKTSLSDADKLESRMDETCDKAVVAAL